MRNIGFIGICTLGLSLWTTPVWANQFQIVNNANEALALACSTEVDTGTMGRTGTVDHGMSADFACDGTFRIQRVGGSGLTIAFDCPSGQTKQVTLTADGNSDDLNHTGSCVASTSS